MTTARVAPRAPRGRAALGRHHALITPRRVAAGRVVACSATSRRTVAAATPLVACPATSRRAVAAATSLAAAPDRVGGR